MRGVLYTGVREVSFETRLRTKCMFVFASCKDIDWGWSVRLRLQNEMWQTNLLSHTMSAPCNLQGNLKDRFLRRSTGSYSNHGDAPKKLDRSQQTNRAPRRSKQRQAVVFVINSIVKESQGKERKAQWKAKGPATKRSSLLSSSSDPPPLLVFLLRPEGIRLVSFVVLEY